MTNSKDWNNLWKNSNLRGIQSFNALSLRAAVTRLSEAGYTPLEIQVITGHSLGSIRRILGNYHARIDALAGEAIHKLETHRG